MAITDLVSGDIRRRKETFRQNERERKRADDFMAEKNSNVRNKRRNSVQNIFTVNSYFSYVRVRATKVFDYLSPSPIIKVLEVKKIDDIENIIEPKQSKKYTEEESEDITEKDSVRKTTPGNIG